ncbi:hypothetical protein SAMN04487910_1943 [Aquimarina amphilecti]|uniref:Uncharacterized protein n=1 Tax=Aquimarina amphilecti TaxID=1038014 RepID=A0A1H7N2D4_AQUAM|nr:hypothetical protein SAMN04487910_1943 [Aquimarina amphilecti]
MVFKLKQKIENYINNCFLGIYNISKFLRFIEILLFIEMLYHKKSEITFM